MHRHNATCISLLALSGLLTTASLAETPFPVHQDLLSGGPGERPSVDVPLSGSIEPSTGNGQGGTANLLEDGPRDVGSKPLPAMCDQRPLTDELIVQCRRWAEIALATHSSVIPAGRTEIAADPRQSTAARFS
jgi:hypothetical protein